ncbi:hypothetical protein [Macrococcus bovicus]|uniref:hypothetical protein n=1 Tax=Macrococcus bovicus TaxID=69968 RepID=UPI0025A5EE91|nr:hypothetical protein [Macrococcus bovicus]WJP97095.1 hypothetical protein QSV55_07360 [Macrococcus bovicus]
MVSINYGDYDLIKEAGFIENPYKMLEWSNSIKDFKFFIYFTVEGWRLDVCRFKGETKQVFVKSYDNLKDLMEKYYRLIELNSLQDAEGQE